MSIQNFELSGFASLVFPLIRTSHLTDLGYYILPLLFRRSSADIKIHVVIAEGPIYCTHRLRVLLAHIYTDMSEFAVSMFRRESTAKCLSSHLAHRRQPAFRLES